MSTPPRKITCDLTDPDATETPTRRFALTQGDTYEDTFEITDRAGDPVDCTGWDAAMELRSGTISDGGQVLTDAVIEWSDQSLGHGKYTFQVPADCPVDPVADLQLTNVSHPDYDVGTVRTPLSFCYVCIQQVTAA